MRVNTSEAYTIRSLVVVEYARLLTESLAAEALIRTSLERR